MSNHWHLLLWPREEGELSEVMRWLSVTHTQRWHANRGTAGSGPIYQGRFKSFPVQSDEHLLTVARYIERNPLRAGLVEDVREWQVVEPLAALPGRGSVTGDAQRVAGADARRLG
jgi:putative transposase